MVFGLRNSAAAASRVVLPSASRRAICSSLRSEVVAGRRDRDVGPSRRWRPALRRRRRTRGRRRGGRSRRARRAGARGLARGGGRGAVARRRAAGSEPPRTRPASRRATPVPDRSGASISSSGASRPRLRAARASAHGWPLASARCSKAVRWASARSRSPRRRCSSTSSGSGDRSTSPTRPAAERRELGLEVRQRLVQVPEPELEIAERGERPDLAQPEVELGGQGASLGGVAPGSRPPFPAAPPARPTGPGRTRGRCAGRSRGRGRWLR